MLTGRRLRLASSLFAVALVAGCAPGSKAASATTAPTPAAAPEAGVADRALTLPLQRSAPASSFLTLGDPEGGARARARVTPLPNGAVLVTGGLTATGATGQVLYFDPLTSSFATLKGATLADARYDHEATLLASSAPGIAEVLVTGGFDDHVQLATVELITIDLAKPGTATSRTLTPLPEARSNHAALLVPLGTKGGKPWSGASGVLVVGGCVPRPGRDAVPAASSILYRLETTEGRVTGGEPIVTSSQPRVARFAHQALLLAGPDRLLGTDDDRVLVFGGEGADAGAVSADARVGTLSAAEVFEPAVDRWATVRFEEGATPAPRSGHRLVRGVDGGALVIGGEGEGHQGVRVVEEISLDGRDAALGALSQGATLARARAGAEVATLEDGRILVVGGSDPASGAALDDAEVLSATGTSVEPPVSIGTGRFEHGIAALGSLRVLIFGGRAARDVFGSPASGLLILRK